jgi:hypothetical protein
MKMSGRIWLGERGLDSSGLGQRQVASCSGDDNEPFGLHRVRRISRLSEELLTSQELPCCLELVTQSSGS